MMDLNKYKYLFLDRDGVINRERVADYVKNRAEFVFENGALEGIKILSELFTHIFVVTNQRGIGLGKMSIDDLNVIHHHMNSEIQKTGGRISSIYFCPDVDSSSANRKPNTGMAYQAQANYKDVIFSESVMVGNSKSDIQFGKNLGMYTVLVGNKYPENDKIYEEIDLYCENLYKFALLIKEGDLK